MGKRATLTGRLTGICIKAIVDLPRLLPIYRRLVTITGAIAFILGPIDISLAQKGRTP